MQKIIFQIGVKMVKIKGPRKEVHYKHNSLIRF